MCTSSRILVFKLIVRQVLAVVMSVLSQQMVRVGLGRREKGLSPEQLDEFYKVQSQILDTSKPSYQLVAVPICDTIPRYHNHDLCKTIHRFHVPAHHSYTTGTVYNEDTHASGFPLHHHLRIPRCIPVSASQAMGVNSYFMLDRGQGILCHHGIEHRHRHYSRLLDSTCHLGIANGPGLKSCGYLSLRH